MKKKTLSLLTIVCMTMALLSANIITAFAYKGTQYGDYLYYTVSNGEAKITDCSSYKTSIVIPEKIYGRTVTGIGKSAFYHCTGLTSVTIPDSVTSIGEDAFKYCTGLTSLTIGNGVTTIGEDAFSDCSSLKKVNISSIEAWCNISFRNIDSNPLCYANNLYLNDELVTNLVIPDSVKSIGNSAFYNCESLTSVTIPDNVTSIDGYAFFYCESLTSVTIGNSVTSIGEYAFCFCESLTSVTTIPDSVTSIGESAFYNCTGLKKVNIPSIEAWCNISFGNYYSNPLYYAHKLYLNDELVTNLIIPGSVTSIGNSAFYNCESLTSVTIPDSVKNIGGSAFESSWNLSVVFYEGSLEDWKKIQIDNYKGVLDKATKIYNVTKKTYKFETNCENKLSDITDYAVMTAPEIKNGSKMLLGWYDNKSFTGNPVSFPYYGEATTLYALWGGTDTVCISAGGDKIFISTLSNIPENASVILACYKGEMLVDVQTEPNKNSSLYFIVKEDFDSAKVMVWDSLDSMNSDYEAEDVILN